MTAIMATATAPVPVLSASTPTGIDRYFVWMRPHDWVALFAVSFSLTLWATTGIPLLPLRPWSVAQVYEISQFLVLGLAVLMALRFAVRIRRRHRADLRLARVLSARHFGREPMVAGLRLILAVQLVMATYTSVKQAIPMINPARYDGALIAIEKFIHFGINPAWMLAGSNPPQWWLTILDKAYYLWFPVKPLVIACFLTTRNWRKRNHFFAAYLSTWLVAVLIGLLWPSHGPCYVDASVFPAAEMRLCEYTQGWLGENYASLETIRAWGNGNLVFGCGLMAMPSLHVTICVLYVIFMWNEKPIWRWGSIIYASLIFLGSLYSGWHYAIDGYAGALIAITVTWITAKLPQMQPRLSSAPSPR